MANVVGRGWHIQCRQACVLCGRIVADVVLIIAWALPPRPDTHGPVNGLIYHSGLRLMMHLCACVCRQRRLGYCVR
jgi:hypothetical protein